MPPTKTPEEQFIDFLQQTLGQQVSVPKHATDVMRVTRFPGLEKPSAPPAQAGVPQQPLDFYGQGPAPAQPPMAPMEPEFPEGF